MVTNALSTQSKFTDDLKTRFVDPPMIQGMPVCKTCQLVFETQNSLETHRNTDNHSKAESGLKPSKWNYFCLLCWQGFRDAFALNEHFSSSIHEQMIASQDVKAVWTDHRLSSFQERTKSSRMSQSKRSRASRSRSPLNKNQNDFSCSTCHLTFTCERGEILHRESERHQAALNGKFPKNPSKHCRDFVCFLCWWAYDTKDELTNHFNSEEHNIRLKRYGVRDVLYDERPISHQSKISSVENDEENFEDFIVLDEIDEGEKD